MRGGLGGGLVEETLFDGAVAGDFFVGVPDVCGEGGVGSGSFCGG